jgi:hypothetical protein
MGGACKYNTIKGGKRRAGCFVQFHVVAMTNELMVYIRWHVLLVIRWRPRREMQV